MGSASHRLGISLARHLTDWASGRVGISQTGHLGEWASLGTWEGVRADASTDVRCPHSTGSHGPRPRGAAPGAPCPDSSVRHVMARHGHNHTMTSREAIAEQEEGKKGKKRRKKEKEEAKKKKRSRRQM